eukprot:TRINITY_DN42568_c0_g1_i1.p1 TRINITY_DN42568_c0_g1~~TRINITY_DN42568_c0_g1_i1.p1  ORF type:complete len:113 (-),score=7.50 TRINITY_DN42568_c0_g1_i1:106-444(-)
MDNHPSPNSQTHSASCYIQKHVLSNGNHLQTRLNHSPHKHTIQNPKFNQTIHSTSTTNPNSTNHQNPQHMQIPHPITTHFPCKFHCTKSTNTKPKPKLFNPKTHKLEKTFTT